MLEAMVELGRRLHGDIVALEAERDALLAELGVVRTPSAPLRPDPRLAAPRSS